MNTGIDRRAMLGTTAAGGLAWSLGTNAARAAKAEANETLVVGVMGTGGRGTTLATEFQKQSNVEVAYVADVDISRARKASQSVRIAAGGKCRPIQDFREILDDESVDILVVATSNHWHAPGAILGCKHGKHVYVEKPASHNAHEGEMMVEAARRYDRRVQLGTQRRSWPKIQEAIERVRSGDAIGRAYYAQAYYTNVRPTIGHGKAGDAPAELDYDLWQGPAPRRPFRDNYLHYNWHWFWNWGNGELGNNGVHMLDLCRWGLEVEHPLRVSCLGGRYRYDDDQETPDTTIATYDFAGGKSITWEGLSCSRMPNAAPGDVVFYGEKGSLRIDGGGYTIHDDRGNETEKETGPGGNTSHVENFLAAIQGEEDLNAEIREGHLTTHLCNLGNIAYRKSRSLTIDPKTGKIVDDEDAMTLWGREYEDGWEPTLA